MTIKYCPISGKRSYATHNEADRVLREIQSHPHRRRKHAGVYPCELGCGAFHITANKDERKRRKRAELRAKRGAA